jgi:nucleoid-associated protein YgaU
MKRWYLLILCLVLGFALSGCSNVKTYTYEVDRVDQDLSRGNKGYIMGEGDEEIPERKPTRTMVGVDVELPPSKEYKARKEGLEEEIARKEPVRVEEIEEEEPVVTLTVPPMPPGAPAEEPVEKQEVFRVEEQTYTVQKGDTLQKISMKFYGTTRKWPIIHEANADAIKHPSRIYPGQVIVIPALEEVVEAEEEYK